MSDARRAAMLELLRSPNETLESVGRLFGVSAQRVHQICYADASAYNRVRRKRRNGGSYMCRTCGKVGHNSRSPDCPKAAK